MKKLILISVFFLAGCASAPKCEDQADKQACEKEQVRRSEQIERATNRMNRHL